MKTKRYQFIKEIIEDENPNALFLEPEFDKALIGICQRYGRKSVAAYNSDICLRILINDQGYDEIEAYEKFQNSLDTTKREENQPTLISDFRKTKIIDLENLKVTDTISELGTNDPV